MTSKVKTKKKPVKKATKKKVVKRRRVVMQKIDIDQIMLNNRELFLNEGVGSEVILRLIKSLRTLDSMSHKPILLWINSPGGSVTDGLALINTMRTIQSNVITIINSRVCSMGSHIAIAGNKRLIYDNGVMMFHDMTTGMIDYSDKIRDRADYLEKYYKMLENNMRKYTKLSERQIKRARTGEVWLFADDCLEVEAVDQVLEA